MATTEVKHDSTHTGSTHTGGARRNWTAGIDEIRRGEWVNPQTGEKSPPAPNDMIVIEDDLDGAEPDLIRKLGMTGEITIVADADTWDALGSRIARNLGGAGAVKEVILDHPHATIVQAEALKVRLTGAGAIVAVGSGTVNDLCKFVTAQDDRRYCVFGTAASMDGYTSTTASMTLENGLKISLPAHAAAGVFLDLKVSAAAPPRMAAAGFGDTLCRSVAQIDWWMSHRLLGTFYAKAPYLIADRDETETYHRVAAIGRADPEAIGYLNRALILSGLGVAFTGVSNHGSMGEHQISHYIDCFAGDRHPGTLHGQQVGVATLTMARIQHWFLAQETPPRLGPTPIDPADMARRMGPEIAALCEIEYRKKARDAAGADRLYEKLAGIWPELRAECQAFALPVAEMRDMLATAGGSVSAGDLGLPVDFYREAVRHGHEMRNRFSFADLACDAGLLDDFAAAET